MTDKRLVPVPVARNEPAKARREYSIRAAGWDMDTLVFIEKTFFNCTLHKTRGPVSAAHWSPTLHSTRSGLASRCVVPSPRCWA